MEAYEENGMIFNILIKNEEGLFVAHCLELDIVATGETVDQARKDIVALICAQVDFAFSNDNLENLYRPAPKEVWEEFFACKERIKKKYKVERAFTKKGVAPSFVPPWIIANTCQKPAFCNV